MVATRVIAVILVYQGNVVQTRRFKVTNVVGAAHEAVKEFASWNADEIIVLNIGRTYDAGFEQAVEYLSRNCFVPLTVGGGIDSVDKAVKLIRGGADKISVNTAALQFPQLITALAHRLGSQAVVVSIDHKIYQDDLWAKEAANLGAGEILLNSVERDGTGEGYDLDLIYEVSGAVSIPVIALGGAGKWSHLLEACNAGADALAVGNMLHYTEHSIVKAKNYLRENGVAIRRP